MRKTRKKIIVLISLSLILLAGVIATSYAVYKSTKTNDIVYEMGSVKIKYSGSEKLSFTNIRAGNIIEDDNAMISFNNLSTVPISAKVTLSLTDGYDGTDITNASRKSLIESLLVLDSSGLPIVKDTSLSTSNKLVYTVNVSEKGEVPVIRTINFSENLTENQIDLLGEFNIGVEVYAEQKINNGTYEYLATSLENIVPGAYLEDLGAVTFNDDNNTLNRPVLVKTGVSAIVTYVNSEGKIVDENVSFSNDTFKIDINSTNWLEKDGYYYYKGVLEKGDTTQALISKLSFSSNLGDKYQNAKFSLKFNNEFLDSDPDVRENGWPSDSELGITDNPGVISIAINGCPTTNMDIGDTATLSVTSNPSNALGMYNWESSNVGIANVDVSVVGGDSKKANVVALSPGTAEIKITGLNGHTDTCVINVNQDPTIAVSSIDLSADDVEVEVGRTKNVSVTINPGNATNQNAVWEVEDPSIGLIMPTSADTHTATVVGLKTGTTRIKVSVDGKISYANLNVIAYNDPNAVSSLTLNSSSFVKTVGEEDDVIAVKNPLTSNASISYVSSNPTIVSVDQTGHFETLKVGYAVIVVSAGDKTAMATVTVKEVDTSNVAVGITVNPKQKTLDIIKGDTVTINAEVVAKNTSKPCTDKVVFTSNNSNVAVVDSNTGKVVPTGVGNAIITATAGSVFDTSVITVVDDYAVESITLSPRNLELEVGSTSKVTATVLPSTTTSQVKYISSNESVATVDSNGNVRALKVGTASIIATAGGKSDSIPVVVVKKTNVATGITVSPTSKTLDIAKNETVTLKAVVTAKDSGSTCTDQVVFTSSNLDVVVVDSKTGKVVPTGVGVATITATAGSVSANSTITVIDSAPDYEVESITLSPRNLELEVGSTSKVTATVLPSTTKSQVKYISSNESVATVDSNGNVRALKVGTASIIATAGGKSDSIPVVVVKKTNVATGITVSPTSKTLDIAKNETVTLKAVVTAKDSGSTCTDQVVFTSSNLDVVVVDSKTGKVVPTGVGVATITATAGSVSANSVITVKNSDEEKRVDSLNLTVTDMVLQIGESKNVEYTISPADTKAEKSYVSLDSSIATVSNTGKVTGVGNGSTYVILSAGGKMATLKVTVYTKTTSVTILEDDFTLDIAKNETKQLHAVVKPDNSSDTDVIWSSLDPSIAFVDSKTGMVIGRSKGTTSIVATSQNKSDSVKVTVIDSGDNYKVSDLIVNETLINMNVGDVKQIIAKKVPESSKSEIKFVSSDSSIATVDEDGKVTGVKRGTVVIVISCGGISKTVTVNVNDPNYHEDLNGTNKNWQPSSKNPDTSDILWLYVGIGIISLAIILIIFFIAKLSKKESNSKYKRNNKW